MINKSEWESSLAAFVQEVGAIRDNRLALARFKAAWQAGSSAIAASQQAATRHQQDTDLEDPLPEATTQQLQHDFQKAYGIVVETHLEPSDALRGRVYREFRRHTMTVIEARKIKSVVAQATPQREESVSLQGGLTLNFHKDSVVTLRTAVRKIKSVVAQATPQREESVSLQGGLTLNFHKDSVVTLRTAVDYFWSLRILAYAWAWAGNYVSKDVDGKDKKMIDLTSAMNYADLALRWCMEFGNGQLSWIQRNDVLTRGKLASRVRRGQNVGSALEEVLMECRLEWRTPSSSALAAPPPSLETGIRRKVTEAPDSSSPESKQRRLNTVSMAKGLGKERHILAAKALPSPFQPKPWPELDIHFVLHTLAVWRESLPLLAQRQRDVLRAIHRALRSVDAALWPFRCASSQRVAHQKSPAFAACMVSLLRWPDRVPAPSALPIKRARHSRLVWCLYFAGQIAPLPLS
eukprot:s1156_g18.t1